MKYLLLIFLSVSLWASKHREHAVVLASAVYHDSAQQNFTVISQHENRLFGNRLVAFYDDQTDTIYLVVRGTDKLQNWIANLHIATYDALLGLLAKKFLPNNWQESYEKLQKTPEFWFMQAFIDLKKISDRVIQRHPNTKIIFAGHSYGGLMANLLAQDAYAQNPNLSFECHTFNAPGAQEIRTHTLEMPEMPQSVLQSRFFNHVRLLDPVANTNTHEGQVLYYKGVSHSIEQFVKDLENGLEFLY